MSRLQSTVAIEVEQERYSIRTRDGAQTHTLAREYGETPNGNSLNGRWVLRDAAGTLVAFDLYRNDLLDQCGVFHVTRLEPRATAIEAADAGAEATVPTP